MDESLEEQLKTAKNERLKIVENYLSNHGNVNVNEWVS